MTRRIVSFIPVRAPLRAAAAATALAAALHSGSAPASLTAQSALPDTLNIAEAIRIAVNRSPALGSARAEAGAAGADRLAAWGALLPTAAASLNLSRSSFTRSTFVGEEGLSKTLEEPLSSASQSGNQRLGLSWTLFDAGRWAEVRRMSAAMRAVQRRYDDRERGVVVTVRRQFLDALRRQRLLALTQGQIADRELELDIARRRYEIAAVERTDVLAAESNLLNAQITLISEQNLLKTGLRQLVVSMGLSPETAEGLALADSEAMPPDRAPDIEALARVALASDPELAALEADRAAASASLWGARLRYLPTISMSLGWGRSQTFGPDESFWQFGLGDTGGSFSISASWNIFDGFAREQRNARAAAASRSAEEELRRRRIELDGDVRRFGAEIEQLAQVLALLERALEISRERLGMQQERYRLGTGTFTELQQAISAAQSAETSLIQRRYDYLIAWSNLAEYTEGSP